MGKCRVSCEFVASSSNTDFCLTERVCWLGRDGITFFCSLRSFVSCFTNMAATPLPHAGEADGSHRRRQNIMEDSS